VLQQKGSLGLEMEHHKSSDSVRISFVKKRSQADKAGLQKGDIVINFRSQQYPGGMLYAQFIALAKQGVRPLVLEITRVDPSIVGSSRRSGLFRKKKHR
jgi:S1-C subfamily serine protease